MKTLYTFGHGTLQADIFRTTLRAASVNVAADVRRFAGSRRNPQFGAAEMRGWLAPAGVTYRAMPELGGRRQPLPDSINTALRHSAFRGYADFMATDAFRTAFETLMALAGETSTAVFCAETLWWRCHRRLIADAAVLLAGFEVVHLTPSTRGSHTLTPGVRRAGDILVYAPAADAGMTLV